LWVGFLIVMACAIPLVIGLGPLAKLQGRSRSEGNLAEIKAALFLYAQKHSGYLPPVSTSRGWLQYILDYRVKERVPSEPRDDVSVSTNEGTTWDPETSYLFNLSASGRRIADLAPDTCILVSDAFRSPSKGPLTLVASGEIRYAYEFPEPPQVTITVEPRTRSGSINRETRR